MDSGEVWVEAGAANLPALLPMLRRLLPPRVAASRSSGCG